MILFDLFAEPLAALMLICAAYAVTIGGLNSKFTKMLFKWVLIMVIANILVHMFFRR